MPWPVTPNFAENDNAEDKSNCQVIHLLLHFPLTPANDQVLNAWARIQRASVTIPFSAISSINLHTLSA